MRIDKHLFAALGIGAVLTLGSIGCGQQRAGNTQDRQGNQTATESSREKSTVRTDNPEDVGGTSSQGTSSQSGQSGTASGTQSGTMSGTQSGSTSGTTGGTSGTRTTTQTERERQEQRTRNRSGSTSETTPNR
jgi:hypothetical protein